MRIRSIKPEFWRSSDVAALTREYRLLFVGLWSYCDDNGVGVDDYRQIAADLFPLDEDPKEARDYVREGLAIFSRALLIVRYEANGKPLIYVPTWDKHQRVDRPNKPRHPRPPADWKPPTSGNSAPEPHLRDVSRQSREDAASGAVEQWSSGAVEQPSSADADGDVLTLLPEPVDLDADFESWWAVWPRKVAKQAAHKAYLAARRKKVPALLLLSAAAEQAEAWKAEGKDAKFIPHAATWLNEGRYADQIEKPKHRRITNPESPWFGEIIDDSQSVWGLGKSS
jgi:hypothetical protein